MFPIFHWNYLFNSLNVSSFRCLTIILSQILKNAYILENVKKSAKTATIFLFFFIFIIDDTPIYKIYIVKFVNTSKWLHTLHLHQFVNTTIQFHNALHKINANLIINNQQREETASTSSTFKPNPIPSLEVQCLLHEEYQRLAVACQAN